MNKTSAMIGRLLLCAFTIQVFAPLPGMTATLSGNVSTTSSSTPNYLKTILNLDTSEKSQVFNDKGHFDGAFSTLVGSASSIVQQARTDASQNGGQLTAGQFAALSNALTTLQNQIDTDNSKLEGAPHVQAEITHLGNEVTNDRGEITAPQYTKLESALNAVQANLTTDESKDGGNITVAATEQLVASLVPFQSQLNADTSTVPSASSIPGRVAFLVSQIVDDTGHLFGMAGTLQTRADSIASQYYHDLAEDGGKLTSENRLQLQTDENSLQQSIDNWAGIGAWGIAHPVAAPVVWQINREVNQIINDGGRLHGQYNTLMSAVLGIKSQEQADASADNGNITSTQAAQLTSELNGEQTQINTANTPIVP